ncbi:MAG: NTP transferase domain-containing protein [Thermoflavifilum sp.]|uniref:sugar phosphate nucleotidyltransferase n=1 Tax=Thermoflavifilum sp. TaxID=1968839 RepID=UPI0018A37CB9|nr:sugar phosphate nucleotidyltransferase [Thermoflavifilum sp.]QOR76140.1 MAG: NTP transferase domain-containing protein [Thermoflavifilum sp.]
MSKPTLLILAAGIASRYGSMKQIQQFGPGGETIMEYSIYDAIRAGFGKVVFIIRRDFEDAFKNIFEPRLKDRIPTAYVYQEMDAFLPAGFQLQVQRAKPWGTAHAVLCARDAIHEPFAVINADDYYGREAFEKMAAFLQEECAPNRFAVLGYQLGNTLSDYGSVSRGVCEVDAQGNLKRIQERTKVYRQDGQIVYEEQGQTFPLPAHTPVSMNFWGFDPAFFSIAEPLFHQFVHEHALDPKAEFLIPAVVDHFIQQGKGTVKVIPTNSPWFGVTYKEDAPLVIAGFKKLVDEGVYPSMLWKK